MPDGSLDELGFENPYYPALLQLGLTYRCNLKCPHCYALFHRTRREFTEDEVYGLIDDAYDLGTTKVVYSHGENLIRKDFHRIAAYIAKKGMYQTLMSNGFYLMDRPRAVALAEAGIKKVMISIDSSDQAEHNQNRGHHSAYLWATKAIEMLKAETDMDVGISMAIDPRNYRTVGDVARLGEHLGVDHISYMQVRPNKPNTFESYNWSNYADICRTLYELIVEYRGRINIYTHDPFMNTLVDDRTPPGPIREDFFAHNDCNVGKYMLSICPNGDVTACNFIDRVVGNLNDTPLAEVWDRTVEEYNDDTWREGSCARCSRYSVCRTGCKAFHLPHTSHIDKRCETAPFDPAIPPDLTLSRVGA